MKAGKIKMLIAVLCIVMCLAALFAVIASAGGEIVTDADMAAIKNAFSAYLVQDTRRVENDGYVGALQYTAYYDSSKGNVRSGIGGTPTILYVINTNTERVGTSSDISIIQSMLDRGYVVVVVDYLDNPKAAGHKLDDSAQMASQNVKFGRWLDKTAPLSVAKNGDYYETFVCPAGYDVLLNQVFWEIDKHSADGTLDKIVENWNTDFKGIKAERLVKWATGDTVATRKTVENDKDGNAPVWYNANGNVDANGLYTKVKFTVAKTITDCVKPDGSPLDMDMLINLVYPTNPSKEVPVLTVSSCWGYPTNTIQCYTDLCSHHTGALFRGYAAAVYDYLWQPMARDDAFGYYDGNLNTTGAVTGDHMNYSIHLYNDKLINTAAIRFLRYLALSESDTYKFDLDAFATIGLSKGGWFTFLGEKVLQSELVDASAYGSTDALETAIDEAIASFTNRRLFDNHHGETRFQAGKTSATVGGVYNGQYTIAGGEKQPWLTYDGKEIISGVQLTYAANGSQEEDISAGHAPMFAAAHMNDEYNAAYGSANTTVNLARSLDIPLVFFEVDQLHEYAYFPDMFYGVETYDAFFDFANYYLKKAPVKVLYTDPYKNDGDISLTDVITVQFSGAVTREQIAKVTVSAGGNALSGIWESVYGGTQWTFVPSDMKGYTEYTITVPADLSGDNGVPMGSAYTSTFKTELALDTKLENVAGKYTFTAPDNLLSGTDSFVFRFAVSNNAANVAGLYDGSDTLLGTVNLKGAGTYEIDITSYISERPGESVSLTLKTEKEIGTKILENRDFSVKNNLGTYTQAPSVIVKLDENGNEVSSGDSAFKIYVADNEGRYGGGDVHYENVASVLAIQKVLGTNSVTKDDYGRQIYITVKFMDTDSRTIQFKMWGMTNSALKVMDYDVPLYNITTKAGEWMSVTIPYTVYEPDYGHTSNNTQSLFISLSPSGDTHKPIYFTNAEIKETVTDITVTDAFLTVKNLGKAPHKAPEAESPFSLYNGDNFVNWYGSFKEALGAYVEGYTLKLHSDYILNDGDLYADIGQKFENVVIDLNGYNISSRNTSGALIWAKNTSSAIKKTSVTLKNGGVELIERPLVSYDGSSASGYGKTFDITLDNIYVRLGKGARLTELISASSVASGANTSVNIRLNECQIDLGDEDDRATVMLTLLPEGDGALDLHYYVRGGSIRMSHPRWITVQEKATYTDYIAGEMGHTKLYLPAAYTPSTKVSYIVEAGYSQYEAAYTTDNVTEYTLVRGAGSTRYGVIPEEYLSADAYPFVLFSEGAVVGAYAKWRDALADAQKTVGSAAKIASEAQLLLRRDYKNVGDVGPQLNALTNLLIDLGGNTFISDDVGLDLSANYASAYYNTNITVKNGKIFSGRIAFIDSQIFTSATGEKVYNVTFDGVTFGFDKNLGDFWGDMLFTPWTAVASPYAATNNLTFENCVFDLRNYPRTSGFTVFNAKDGNQVLGANIKLIGGEILMDSAQYLTFAKLDSKDSLCVAPDENGNYITLKVNSGVSPITDNFRDERGGNRSFALESDNGTTAVYTLNTNQLATDYGVIDAAYADSSAYPFALFKDGAFIGAYSTWSAATGAAQNAVSGAGNISSAATLLMRRDFGNYNRDTGAVINAATNIVLDLGGYSFTQAWVGFDLSANYNAAPYKTTINIKNGNVLNAVGMGFVDIQHNSGSAAKQFEITYDNVTFGFAAGADTSWSTRMIFEMWGTNAGAGSVTDATFNNCVFNLRDNVPSSVSSSNKMNLFPVSDGTSNANVHIAIRGGEIICNNLGLYNIFTGDAGDTINWSEGKDGKMTKLTVTPGTAHYTGAVKSGNTDLYFVEMEESVYYLTNLKTPYSSETSVSNSAYLSAVDYPFFIYYNEKLVSAETTWRAAVDKAETYVDSASEIAVSNKAYVVLRRDYIVNKSNGSGTNFLNTMGEIVVDLSGYMMTNTDNYFVDIYVNYTNANYLTYVSSMEIKNGTLMNTRPGAPMICIGHTGSNANAKSLNFSFTNVTFRVSAGEKAVIQEWTGGSHVGSGVHTNYRLEGCIFDFTGAGKDANFLNLANDKNNVTLVIKGGHIIADSFSNYKLYSVNNTDTVYLEADELGKYITLTQLSSSAAPSVMYKNKDGKTIAFGKASTHAEFTDYVIGMSIETKYGEIPYTYVSAEQYPFAVFCGGKFVGAYSLFGKDASASALHNSKTAGSVILLRRDFIYTEGQYNNLSQTYGVTLDLGGFTFTSTDRVMFHAQKKTANDTNINVLNGTVILSSKALMSLSSWDPSTGGWEPYKGGNGFIFTFDGVKIVLANGASTSDVICFNSFAAADPNQFLDITFNNCTFDLSGSAKALSLFDMTNALCKFDAKINGGKIITNGAYLNLADMAGANENSSLVFGKQSGENYTAFELPSGKTPNISAVNGGELVLVKIAELGGTVTYRLRPLAVAELDFVPKMSLTLDRDLILNVYVPAAAFLNSFTLDGAEYTDLAALQKVTVDERDYYLVKISLDAKSAARDVVLRANVNVGDKTATGTFTFGVIKYAEKILTDGGDVEKALVKDVLSYVRAAYAYFKTEDAETVSRINAILGDAYDSNNAPVIEGSATATANGLKSATFSLDGTPNMRFYLADGADASKYEFFINGTRVKTETSADGKYIDIDVYAYALCETVTYTVDGVESGSFHIGAYYEWSKTQNNEALVNLVARFWKYLQSARAYRDFVIEA